MPLARVLMMMPKMAMLQKNGRYVQRVSKHPRTGSHSRCPLAQQTLESCTTAAKAASTTTQRSVATKLLQAMAPRLPKTATMLVASLQAWYLVNPCETHTAVISIDATLTHAATSSSLLPARASTLAARLYTITACPGACCHAVHRSSRRSPHAVPACACSFLCLTVQADACTSCEPFDFELTIAHIMPAVTPRHLYGTWSSCWSASPWMQQATMLMPACASLSFEHWACWPSPCGECVHPTRPVAPAAS